MESDENSGRKLISIICPVYNEEQTIPIFHKRLKAVLESYWDSYDFELIFTNNRSEDRSLEVILSLRDEDPWIHVITLSRNFGYQGSLMSGLQNAAGDVIIFIDVDCEDPPEMIPQLLEGWEQGYDIVYGERVNRPEAAFIKLGRFAFYRLAQKIADNDFILDMAEFSLFIRPVRDCILLNRSTYPYIRADIGSAGFKRLNIPYTRHARVSGKTNYHVGHMISAAIGGILSSSTFPLRLVAYVGVPVVLAQIVVIIAWIGGVQFDLAGLFLVDLTFIVLALIFIAAYVARIYKDGIQRPIFVIDPVLTHLDRPVVERFAQL